MNYENQAKNYALFFENLNKDLKIDDYEKIFSKYVYFEDPFQKVYDLKELVKIFNHMYETLHEPNFKVIEIVTNEKVSYLRWYFKYKFKKNSKEFESFVGVSRIEFTPKGKVISHIDYWDSGVNIYGKIPVLSLIIKFIIKRIKA